MSESSIIVLGASEAPADPRNAYQRRLEELSKQLGKLQRRDLRLVRIRTGLFVTFVALAILCIGESGRVSWWWLLLPTAVFFALLPIHQRLMNRLDATQAARRFHDGRLKRFERQFHDDEEDGSEFRNEDHPGYEEAGDQILRNFLNGLIIYKRGHLPQPKQNLKEEDIVKKEKKQ